MKRFDDGFIVDVIHFPSGISVIVTSEPRLIVYGSGIWTQRWFWHHKFFVRSVAALENDHLVFTVSFDKMDSCSLVVQNVVTGQVKAMVPCAMGLTIKAFNKKEVCVFDHFCRVEHYDFSDVLQQ